MTNKTIGLTLNTILTKHTSYNNMAGSLSFPIVLIAYIMEFLMAYMEHYPPGGNGTERTSI